MRRRASSDDSASGRDDRSHKSAPSGYRGSDIRSRARPPRAVATEIAADEPGYELPSARTRKRGSLEIAPGRLRLGLGVSRRRTRKAVVLIGMALVLMLTITVAGVLGYGAYLSRSIAFQSPAEKQQIQAQLARSWERNYNVLVAGVDPAPFSGAYRTDTMVLMHVDPTQKRVWLLSIPRDTQYFVPNHGDKTVSDAHLYGGPAGSIQAVRRLTGLPVSFYMEVRLAAIQKAVDGVGGIWANVPASIDDTSSDSSPDHSAARISAGYQLLDGYHALTFVRARPPFANQDYTRMADQQLVLGAVVAQLAKGGNFMTLLGFATSVAPLVKTNMSLSEIADAASTVRGAGAAGIYSATVVGNWKSSRLEPDAAALAGLVGDIRAQHAFETSRTTLAALAAKSAAAESTKPPSRVTVTVNNGSGISGAAKQAAGVLQTQGFPIAATGNASQNVYKQTLVVYNSDVSLANLVAQFLPPGTRVVRANGMYQFKTDILVVIGKDWDLSKVPVAPIMTQ